MPPNELPCAAPPSPGAFGATRATGPRPSPAQARESAGEGFLRFGQIQGAAGAPVVMLIHWQATGHAFKEQSPR